MSCAIVTDTLKKRNRCGSASRIDRLYFSDFKKSSITSFNRILCPFSDHCVVSVSVKVETRHARNSKKDFCDLLT